MDRKIAAAALGGFLLAVGMNAVSETRSTCEAGISSQLAALNTSVQHVESELAKLRFDMATH